ncbi:MAG: glycoside hydrolase family 20 zincin-like fold domain-containing protein [Promethearchaeota archaeon]
MKNSLKFIPTPQKVEIKNGVFKLSLNFQIYANSEEILRLLNKIIFPIFPVNLRERYNTYNNQNLFNLLKKQENNLFFFVFSLIQDNSSLQFKLSDLIQDIPSNNEGFLISIDREGMFCLSMGLRGIFYCMHTLKQYLLQINPKLADFYFANKNSKIKDKSINNTSNTYSACKNNERTKINTEHSFLYCNEITIIDYPKLSVRGFHLDLKQMNHSFPYIKQFIEKLAEYKYNYLLMEYADKFPYKAELDIVRGKYALSETRFQELLNLCKENFIEIIPFVQILENTSYILKHEEFAKYRESRNFEDVLCPLNRQGVSLILELINQICAAHPDSKYICIGGNQIKYLGLCPRCSEYKDMYSEFELFTQYFNFFGQEIKKKNKIPLIFQDKIVPNLDSISELDKSFVIFYWDFWTKAEYDDYLWISNKTYKNNITTFTPNNLLEFYEEYYITPDFPNSVRSLPFIEFFKDRGFEIIGGPAISCEYISTIPYYQKRIPNITSHCFRMQEAETLGTILLSNSKAGNPLETQWLGILWHAENSWKFSEVFRKDYDEFSQNIWINFFGVSTKLVDNCFSILKFAVDSISLINLENVRQIKNEIPELIKQLNNALQYVRKNQNAIRSMILGLIGIFTQARYIYSIKFLHEFINDSLKSEISLSKDQLQFIQDEFRFFIDDINNFYQKAQQFYSENGILMPLEIYNAYEKSGFFSQLRNSANFFIESLDKLILNEENENKMSSKQSKLLLEFLKQRITQEIFLKFTKPI